MEAGNNSNQSKSDKFENNTSKPKETSLLTYMAMIRAAKKKAAEQKAKELQLEKPKQTVELLTGLSKTVRKQHH
jgi:hypothetical protein